MTTIAVTGPRVVPAPPRHAVRRPRATLPHQLLRFAAVGCLGTAVSAVLYLVFRLWWDAAVANLAAIALSTVVSTEANRRFTFDGAAADRIREYVQSAATVAFCAVSSSAALVVLVHVVDEPTVLHESLSVAGASVLGGLIRFLVLRNWVFGVRATV